MTSSNPAAWPLLSATGSRSPSPLTIGWSRLRTGAASTVRAPDRVLPASGWASLRSTASRRPEVSERGDRRSCGRVSQAGKQATEPSGSSEPSALVRSSASRAVAVTASTKRGWPAGAVVGLAMEAARKGRSAGGATRSVSASPRLRARCSWGSAAMTLSSPARLIVSLGQHWRLR